MLKWNIMTARYIKDHLFVETVNKEYPDMSPEEILDDMYEF